MSITRRDILKSLTLTAMSGSVLRVIPLEAAEMAHRMVKAEKAAANQVYAPKFFSAHAYKMLQSLCQTIIPADEEAKGAIEAGAPEFIDLITSENKEYQVMLGGGLMWLDNTCIDRYGNAYLDCTAAQQKEILDLIAYRKNAKSDPALGQGIEFFGWLRKLTADGFFTSEIGISYLGYIGNTFVAEFPGCPPVPE
ncbi:MAG TPA: gluconate 2-dehydrogenase subunit 3 family protein [Candidatus Solibacter sp.]|nr:gluconate 2-dehydrogenase subunit 3 family protein [Candidatus Solibacter sp.]